ncbi:Two component system histidine kinase [Thermoclostridium stercorarium subsp. stercorarium DSM 8532]|uniref:histidine kinase n=2 Tax=Thermoclostridium stercorarium TaxID=1510 RepID=L7VM68_THES1|nr:sensor histidine kinase [Thermoclostridium stercorarium]AGC69310.1 Two component system histidine kinase [Thermoclostridium stercorarium subsp. stercorarium DSM 8532]AGI40273.1 signal transduction protein [Thermoclostridium stercorarium subsp. stercorarium DSM 8532]ANX02200.1 histidine kinase [Thermoclostridium stercorarium subsp. leptospartum DSM 9219]
MFRFKNQLSIKKKLILINIIVAIVPVIAFAVLLTDVYDDSVNKRTEKSVEDSSKIIASRITRVLRDAENCSNYLTVNINKAFEEQLSQMSQQNVLNYQKAISNELYVSKIIFDEIDSVAFYSVDGNFYVSDYSMLKNIERFRDSPILRKLEATTGKSIWFPYEKREYMVRDADRPVLTLGKKVIRINSGEPLGYLIINVSIGSIERNLENQLISYFLLDDNNRVISYGICSETLNERDALDLIDKSARNVIQRHKGRKYFISRYRIEDYQWTLIAITDLDKFNVDAKRIFYLVIVVATVATLLEIALSGYLTSRITEPLMKLKKGAEEIAKGNMKIRFNFKTGDEIGQLGKSFNYMTEKVEELLKKVDYEARKKREYELSLLHQQVKPHFLYNTLDIIIKLIEMNKNGEARRATSKLADYYRNSLSDRKEIITVGQEIRIVEDYLELQKIRYGDLFTYEIDVDAEIENMLIPKLTLQPLVENAIYHGIKYLDRTGNITITGRMEEDYVILSVEDNGVGMKKETLESILLNNVEGHFGVYSVNHRIKLMFGDKYGISVNSTEGLGTKVDIRLPKEQEGVLKQGNDEDNDCG